MALKVNDAGGEVALGYDTATDEAGLLLKIQVAETVVKGEVLSVSPSVDNKYVKQSNEFDATCIAAEGGSADAFIWAWTTGAVCQVLLKDTVAGVRGWVMISADTDGRADCIDIAGISGNPAVVEHFKEIGHCKQAVGQGTNKMVLIHFHTL